MTAMDLMLIKVYVMPCSKSGSLNKCVAARPSKPGPQPCPGIEGILQTPIGAGLQDRVGRALPHHNGGNFQRVPKMPSGALVHLLAERHSSWASKKKLQEPPSN